MAFRVLFWVFRVQGLGFRAERVSCFIGFIGLRD